ncbi:hypothetical protein GCK72_000583 [Caenorhabditis remanei]|uniref:Protein-tyrosine-phosphatase n=1 Tax=Caenorhabditis remanei TaxID=31234 RepID=A0A6A5HKR3_CAERE|nr:hypothetical protein GCK72_000583 [Caenorhabditis remanei]KAF1768770.1 hypothetical protein GCK72_000583 [Caenorhabditis remanei]
MSRNVGVLGQMSEINDHLYLSGAGVLKPEKIKQRKINMIVNATTEEPSTYMQGVDTMKIRIEDHPYARLSEHFDVVADKIRNVKERGGKTLVHCMAGVSRSASLVMIYLVKHEHMTLRQAYHYVKAARPIIRPNVGFWKQMVDYEKRLRGTASIKMVQTPECDMPIPDIYVDDLRRMQISREIARHSLPSAQTPSTKQRAFSASTYRPSSVSTGSSSLASSSLRRAYSPSSLPASSLALTTSYSLFSPAPTRKPRQSLFSMYSTAPRHNFFSAF